jgi:hypothetical protein
MFEEAVSGTRGCRAEGFGPRWWNIYNSPQLGWDGSVQLIVHRVDDVTDFALATLGNISLLVARL